MTIEKARPSKRHRSLPGLDIRPSNALRYRLLCLAIGCQLATVAMTWQVWQVRHDPVNVPLFPLPPVSFGWAVVLTLVAAFVWPKQGVAAHAVVVGLACIWDQYRLQPQFLSLIVLMFACVSDDGMWAGRWYLSAMWLWAGLHKFLSPEWFGSSSWSCLEQSGVDAETWHLPFAVLVPAAETALGLAAISRPRLAAVGCLVLHLAILISLSPLVRDFNPSVWPWNLATAIVGFWLLRQTPPPIRSKWWWAVPAVLFFAPATFYIGLLNPHLAFVLYSGNMPRAYHTTSDSVRPLHGWGRLEVPFPDSAHLLARSFELTAEPGDKLYVHDPRAWLADQYFIQGDDHQAQSISRRRFRQAGAARHEVRGIEMADPEVLWQLGQAGVGLSAMDDSVSFSATAKGPASARELFQRLPGLPNLSELKLTDADVSDKALDAIRDLPRLESVDLRLCRVATGALADIAAAPELRYLHIESTPLKLAGLRHLSSLRRLEALHLPSTQIDDAGLLSLGELPGLLWLDLSHNRVTDVGAAHLRQFPACEWINLAGTQITDAGAIHLGRLENLEIAQLSRTGIGDAGLTSLGRLSRLQHLDLEGTPLTDAATIPLAAIKSLRHLNVRGTRITGAGVARLQELLPECDIVR